MAASQPVANFFAQRSEEGGIVVKDAPKLDLDLYIQNYQGRTRYDRLLHIGRTSVPLCIEALRSAVLEAKTGRDVSRYRQAQLALSAVAPEDAAATFDQAWVTETDKGNNAEQKRLEAELKGYKNNLIKESIRMGHEDIAKHLEAVGNLSGAIETYTKMRPDVSTSKQVIDVGRHLIGVYLQRREWSLVQGNVNKITGLQNTDDETAIQPYVRVVQGIALMGLDKYAEAALAFLQADASSPSSAYADVATPNDVATYGGLLALATMDRQDLQKRVLENPNFRTFLELESHIRKAISLFVNGRYSACLHILEGYRSDYLLDIYLQPHVAAIYSQIRSKCITHYLRPFSCVTLESMNTAFSIDGASIEGELVTMVQAGSLKARIDAIEKVVTTTSADSRALMQKTALEAARDFERYALERIRRMNLAAADLEVKPGKKTSQQANMPDEMVFEHSQLV